MHKRRVQCLVPEIVALAAEEEEGGNEWNQDRGENPARLYGEDARLVALAVPEADLLAPDLKGGVVETKAEVLEPYAVRH
jgi:hypothetical protein